MAEDIDLRQGAFNMADSKNDNRGFASMDKEKQKEIASKGDKAAHEKGTAHEFDSKEASKAGKKGGQNSHKND
ncbi:MAG: KGG domain-containing protein [Pseudohongiellaceae bacterium]